MLAFKREPQEAFPARFQAAGKDLPVSAEKPVSGWAK
jgi:hypothetical protein